MLLRQATANYRVADDAPFLSERSAAFASLWLETMPLADWLADVSSLLTEDPYDFALIGG